MMTTIMVGMHNSILVVNSSNECEIQESLKETKPQSIAFDPLNSGRAYCATFGNGLWKTDDGGRNWSNIGKDIISSSYVTSVAVAVSSLNSKSKLSRVYAGTEPSALYISNDGGDSWKRMKAFNDLPSSKSWSFPPRPWTHHVRWIEPDANDPDYIFVAIEAGALVQSRDGGKTWIDRSEKLQGPYDTHTLATHPKAPKRLYSSAGDGYFESFDYGENWARPMDGLRHDYLLGLSVDSRNPEVVIVSASNGPSRSYVAENAETYMYRKDADSNGWKPVTDGLPEPRGSTIMSLASNANTGEFYAVNNHGLFLSTNSGNSWEKLNISWPREYLHQTPWALAIN